MRMIRSSLLLYNDIYYEGASKLLQFCFILYKNQFERQNLNWNALDNNIPRISCCLRRNTPKSCITVSAYLASHVTGPEAAPAHQERLEIISASGHSVSCCVLIINETARRGKAALRPALLPLTTLRFIHKTKHPFTKATSTQTHDQKETLSQLKKYDIVSSNTHMRRLSIKLRLHRNRHRKKS